MIRLAVLLWSVVLVCVVLPTANAQDDAHGVREFTESGTWRVPPGVARITIELSSDEGGYFPDAVGLWITGQTINIMTL